MAKMVWESEEDLLEEAKRVKKRELSSACQDDILSGFNVSIDDKEYHFSYDREAQVNLQERWQLFQNHMAEELVVTAHVGEESVRLTVDKRMFERIYMKSVMAKENKIKKLRDDLYPLVDSAKSKSDLEAIRWDMEIIEPKPGTVILKDDELLSDEIKRIETGSAITTTEIMNVIALSNMMGGMSL